MALFPVCPVKYMDFDISRCIVKRDRSQGGVRPQVIGMSPRYVAVLRATLGI